MTRLRLLTVVLALAAAGTTFVPADPAAAHSGTDTQLTSNYRVRITQRPDVAGLTVALVDAAGQVRVTWRGSGTVEIPGYEGEPYLRLSPRGVERNTRSPATYLNADRYGSASLPDDADASAPPEWELISSEPSVTWHDHRTHWMSPVPPAAVRADPGHTAVVFDRWEIPLLVDGDTHVVAGDLTWVPPPNRRAWLLGAGVVAALVGLGLYLRPRIVQPVAAWVGAALFTLDTALYVGVLLDSLPNRLFTFVGPVVACIAAVGTVRARHLVPPRPTVATLASGLVLAYVGGVDRAEVLSNSQILSTGPDWVHRVSVVTCLGIGVAFVAWFAVHLARPVRHPRQTAS